MMSGMGQRFFLEALQDDWAVLGCEGGLAVLIPRAWLPYQAREGDEIVVTCAFSPDTASRALRVTAVRERVG